ncbi:Na/Pi cotransporter family protein [Spongiibacter sp. KMU-158]|uniref:Na/Pi cotransporter family protein n=1 Tax=Spongiibacter pelagi TaxID=2760804 RepID=A0A927C5D0_9GAMM|nr:Na/Pi symporter [Spongiibacter pelagi]MBD2859871.1 Na/Pi cotransporter family protein [Spongiibacter pelagi]
METIHILMAGLTAIILFVFGLENFSREIERISGERFRKSLAKVTRIPAVGVLIGALVTAVIQSSSATSVIAISLVNAGILSFKNSVGIIFGANIGTTITAQLVAFKLTSFAPIFIITGFFLTVIRSRYSMFGKAVFYFGFVFFSLNLISSSLQPLQSNPALIAILTEPHNPLYGILFGCLFTALIQSSSVTTGLAIIFTQQGILGLENAVPLIMGANIGTTATALLSMVNMDASAKKTALSHFLFNIGGVLIFLPALYLFDDKFAQLDVDPAIALANIHLVFNLATSLIFIVFITPFTRLVDLMLGEGKMDFERLDMPVLSEEDNFDAIQQTLKRNSNELLAFLQENYNLVTLSIESNYQSVFNAAGKRIEYVEFLNREYIGYFSKVVVKINDEQESKELIRLINQFDYLFQIHDSISDLYNTKKVLSEHFVELKSDILLLIRELSSESLLLFDGLKKGFETEDGPNITALSREMQGVLDDTHRQLLTFMADPERKDLGALTNFVTYSQRLKDKLINYAKIAIKDAG